MFDLEIVTLRQQVSTVAREQRFPERAILFVRPLQNARSNLFELNELRSFHARIEADFNKLGRLEEASCVVQREK
jgi:hypothetical protein